MHCEDGSIVTPTDINGTGGPPRFPIRLCRMDDKAAEFREYAAHCRKLADGVDESLRLVLLSMATDFDDEATRIENEAGPEMPIVPVIKPLA